MSEANCSTQIEYRPIEGHPDYRVGNDGSVWTRRVFRKHGQIGEWRRIVPLLNRGYPIVSIAGKTRFVHHLVLLAFVGPKPTIDGERIECCHNNGIPDDNRPENLRWGTRTENERDKFKHGTFRSNLPERRGEKNFRAILTESQVREIRAAKASGEKPLALASRFHVATRTINAIVNRAIWKHIA